jgi:predicted MFS family arabinose efflux permease
MVCYSIGCAVGSIASTLAYDRAGWPGVCTLGAFISAAALAWWRLTQHAERAPACERVGRC